MSLAKKCDLCGKLYEPYNEKRDKMHPNGYALMSIDTNMKYFQYKQTDCCPDCMEAILQTITNLGGNKHGSK